MLRQTLYLWKQAPFLRLLIPLMAGILLQWYAAPPVWLLWILLAAGLAGLILFNRRLSFYQYKFSWLNGLFINSMFLALGALLTWQKDGIYGPRCVNSYYHDTDLVTATLQEPVAEKTNSYKAVAAAEQLLQGDNSQPVTGNIIIYFKKDSRAKQLGYGAQIVFTKILQPIKNTGNPGAFDYERYTRFRQIYRQVYLLPQDYVLLPAKKVNRLQQLLFTAQQKVLLIINRYVPGEKEAGLAEALLLGYKDDLDKTLVQSYSNTGVVHIIAISGMHLGLIYWLLSLVLQPFKKRKQTRWLVPVIVIAGLWLFALLTGGGPSILRSAVMFTCIVLAETLERKTFIYNSLAASAFVLLCINPFWLWDAGFQLSYAAVLSIVIFTKPVYNWFYFENKIIDNTWKLMAVTLAAQVLTTPISMYHFHQFPIYFLLTNLLAVPLSSLIILGEIFLCLVSPLPAVASITGALLHWLIQAMNRFIEHMETLPFSLWNGLQLNTLQLLFLYGATAALAYWLLQKNKTALFTGLICLLGFAGIRSWSFISAGQQQQLIVYNVPKHQAMDFISGRNYSFKGDTALLADDDLQNFHLKPSRILHRTNEVDSMAGFVAAGPLFLFNHKKILLAEKPIDYRAVDGQLQADLIIISKNAPVQLSLLAQGFGCKHFVLDASNAFYKVNKWKAEAAKLGLDCFSVVDNGAFVMNMD